MKYYLAYGSNLNKAQMAHRCPDAVPVGVSRLRNYKLVFRRGVLTIEPKIGSYVPIGVWEISEEDEKNLDRYEGFPKFYGKSGFPIMLNGFDETGKKKVSEKVADAIVYIMTPGHPISGPSNSYFCTVIDGYHDFGFTEADRKLLWKAYEESRKEEIR